MSLSKIDLRSDTVTSPSEAMRRAIAEAPVGDDVCGEDPSVIQLEEHVAELLGKELAIYMPSGTMTNQIGVRLHCDRGEQFLCEEYCHVFQNEQTAFAQLSGISARTIAVDDGILRREHLEDKIRPENVHVARTQLLCLENTHNYAGGRILPFEVVKDVCSWAHENGLATHLDGARLWNAVAATDISAAQWSQPFDTVSVCFSKGLGAPVGSALAGSGEHIHEARRHRKAFGGGMRQAGIMAAAAVYALEHNRDRLIEDHQNAKRIAEVILATDGVDLVADQIDTNLIIFRVDPKIGTAQELIEKLQAKGVLMSSSGLERLRAVTHLDVSASQIAEAMDILVGEVAKMRS